MKITRLEFWTVGFPLREPYTIAYETISVVENVFLRIVTDAGVTGIGSAAPDLPVTGETAETVLSSLRLVEGALIGENPLHRTRLLEITRRLIPQQPSARAAIDLALHDLLGKVAKLPLWILFGGERERIVTSITIGIMDINSTVEHAREFVRQGFLALKLKGGASFESDIESVLKVREAIGPGIEMRFDANQGYTVEQAKMFVEKTLSAKLELLEQPTPKDRPGMMGTLSAHVSLPVMADESLMGLMDAFHLARADHADMVNVKLMKVGGLDEALQVNSVARAAGIEVMIGCMDESALSISAGLHFALGRPNVLYADLDGHLDLLDDPAAGAVILRDGYLYPNSLPGLGSEM